MKLDIGSISVTCNQAQAFAFAVRFPLRLIAIAIYKFCYSFFCRGKSAIISGWRLTPVCKREMKSLDASSKDWGIGIVRRKDYGVMSVLIYSYSIRSRKTFWILEKELLKGV